MASRFLVFNYEDEHTITVMVFDDTMCLRHYTASFRANADSSSSPEDDEYPRATISFCSRATMVAMYPIMYATL
jgi:hypothetical protein